jgi:hypothetical protein
MKLAQVASGGQPWNFEDLVWILWNSPFRPERWRTNYLMS